MISLHIYDEAEKDKDTKHGIICNHHKHKKKQCPEHV